jgi:uroporphyrinogen decarboxylase
MSPIQACIKIKSTNINPIWLMRQAGRYLPEFKDIRSKNPDFIKLCLNENLSSEITIQPLRRFAFDAAIIFSDILMLPYGLGQNVNFKKNFGPQLGEINLDDMLKKEEKNFINRLNPVYKALKIVSKDKLLENKDLIGFIGAPWTLLVYMINKISPKKGLKNFFFKDKLLIKKLLLIINKFLKVHIEQQVKNGASIIQIFDSWAGLVDEKDMLEYIYIPTLEIVNYVKSLNVPVICFPRGIKKYKEFVNIVKPDVLNIDYEVDPKKILKEINIPIQGGLDPKILLTDKENLKKEANYYLGVFKNHPYIFNLGHGVLPDTDPMMVDYLVKYVKNFK